MTLPVYYNDNDRDCAKWIKSLIAANLIPDGHVDERSILDVEAKDLEAYRQCHFFAGIGGWPYALQLASWPADREVWTGSCPCQPFSCAGKGLAERDDRHLWPAFRNLIAERRPATIFGEQVASKLGRRWLAGVRADLEAMGYAVGAADLCAAGVGAPHIRQRLWWVADAEPERTGLRKQAVETGKGFRRYRPAIDSETCGVANADGGNASAEGVQRGGQHGQQPQDGRSGQLDHGMRTGPVNSFWRDAEWLFCRDGKWRRVEPGTFPLAHGVSRRAAKLRGLGNAIVPQVAAKFIRSFLETSL